LRWSLQKNNRSARIDALPTGRKITVWPASVVSITEPERAPGPESGPEQEPGAEEEPGAAEELPGSE